MTTIVNFIIGTFPNPGPNAINVPSALAGDKVVQALVVSPGSSTFAVGADVTNAFDPVIPAGGQLFQGGQNLSGATIYLVTQ
jgi:hypothetical protein